MSTKNNEQILTNDLRKTLKSIMLNELEKLPDTLEGLEPKDRLSTVCKLMPYVFPKVETIHSKTGEPFSMDEWN